METIRLSKRDKCRAGLLSRRHGFTLAEVLITLGVIGVVAAITIPALVKNNQKIETVTKLEKFYSTISQVIKMSEIDNGEFSSWDFTIGAYTIDGSKSFFNQYFKPYLRELKFCSDGFDSSCGEPVSGGGANYIFNNGIGFSVVLGSSTFYMLIDLNNSHKPNKFGEDVFYFSLNATDGFVPYGYTKGITREQIIDNGDYKCTTDNKYMCTALIMIDGWQIKDDYPW